MVSYIFCGFFYEPGEGVRNQNHLGWTGLCFANFKNPEWTAGPNGPGLSERESRNLFFSGTVFVNVYNGFAMTRIISTSPVGGKRNDIMCSKKAKIIRIAHSFHSNVAVDVDISYV